MAGSRARLLRLLLLSLVGGSAGTALAADEDGLVLARAGNLPILLTVPHGGLRSVPNASPRSRGTVSTDGHTIELAQALAAHLANGLGAQPYLVAARFSRKYIDANRAEAEAFDAPGAKQAYDAYHGQIRRFITQIRERFPRGGLLLDIHGQSEAPDVVHRGTRDGATVVALIRKHGPDALVGPQSLLGFVRSKGYKVFPAGVPIGNPAEDRRYNGGHTVHTYGSRNPDGLDAMQLEIGRDLRRDAAFISVLGEGIAVFYRAYLVEASSPRSMAPDDATIIVPRTAACGTTPRALLRGAGLQVTCG